MKILIINADDMGMSDAVNEAVIECYKAGAITGTSLMACGRRFKEAARMLRDVGSSEAGVHLTLTGRFRPCSKDAFSVRTLTGKDGLFLPGYLPFALRYACGNINREEVRNEFTGQIKAVLAEGFRITHLDSHEHVHMFPSVLDEVISLASGFGIKYIRLPLESPKMLLKGPYFKDVARHAALKALALGAKRKIKLAGIFCNDMFLGHVHSGRLDEGILRFMTASLSDGASELAVHPAVLSKDLLEESPWHVNGAKEMKALTGGTWRAEAGRMGVSMFSHGQFTGEKH